MLHDIATLSVVKFGINYNDYGFEPNVLIDLIQRSDSVVITKDIVLEISLERSQEVDDKTL